MAGTIKPNRRRKPEKAPEEIEPRAATNRRREILGVIVMALALLVSLAIVTYDAADDSLAERLSLWEIIDPVPNTSAENAMGLVGAVMARALVPSFLGYTVLLLTALLFVVGYVILRKKNLRWIPYVSVMTLYCAAVFGIVITRIGLAFGSDWTVYGGAVGTTTATWLRGVFGTPGSFGVLFVFVVVSLMVLIDHDIQRWFDRVESGVRSIPSWTAAAKRIQERRRERLRTEFERAQTPWEERGDSLSKSLSPALRSTRRAPSPPPEAPLSTGEAKSEEAPEASTPPVSEKSPTIELKITGPVHVEKTNAIVRNKDVPREASPYRFPTVDLLDAPDDETLHIDYAELEENKRTLLNKLAVYKIEITNINAVVGPTVTLYELTPSPGVKISRIRALEDDLAMATAARGIRLIAPIPSKSVVGVEIPNRVRELVRLHSIIGTTTFRDANMQLPIALGKTIEGEVFLEDLAKMPHLLIAGATGSGKSVGLNTLIAGLLYACHPSNLKFVMVDPKKIELQQYRDLREHYLALPEGSDEAVITEVADALGVLKGCEREMEQRYNLLQDARVRGIKEYNKVFEAGKLDPKKDHRHLPYIVVIVDELADLMMTAGKDIEAPIARLAQMARAIGIHLVLATQRPSVDVITGLIKANFPSRVAFQVASKIDARTILDQNGAERLVGNGDMLFMQGSRLVRLQAPFISVDEVDRLMAFVRSQPGPGPYMLPNAEEQAHDSAGAAPSPNDGKTDELFEEAARIIVRSQQGSVSLLQRRLSVGYTRAARIVDQLEEAGIVGAFVGSKARDVLLEDEIALDSLLDSRE